MLFQNYRREKLIIMKRKIMIAAVCASLALMTAACGDKKAAETGTAETVDEAVDANVDEDIEEEVDEADDTGSDTDVSEYYTETPVGDFGTIASADAATGDITINTVVKGSAADSSDDSTEEVVYHTIDGVPIIDAVSGLPVDISELQKGSDVYAWAGDTMTMSLPPQTNLQAMIVNIPADAPAPQYVVVKGLEWSKDDTDLTFTDQDGRTWNADSAVQITPYLTKQIVKLEDVKNGSRLFVWPSSESDASEGDVSKIVLMNE